MQCGGSEFCPWPREAGHRSCCHKCRKTRGMYHAPYCISRNQNTRSQDAEPGSRDRGEASRILADAASVESRDADAASVDNRNVDAASVETREPANAEASAATGGRCVVCFVSAATHAFVPCGHRCVCEECASIVVFQAYCPICRSWVQSSLRIYLS